jgi:hypothetical protein
LSKHVGNDGIEKDEESEMSRVYQVEVKSSVSESFTLSDTLVRPLSLTPILSQEEMGEIMASILEKRGFQEVSAGRWQTQGAAGEEIVFDLEKMEMQASLSTEKSLSAEATAKGVAYDKQETAQENALVNLQREEERIRVGMQKIAESERGKVAQKLLDSEAERLKIAHQILQETYAESLKRKAQQLGEVMDIRETSSQDQYDLVIRIAL